MMDAAPAAPLEMIQAQLVLQFLVVALDAPAELGQAARDRRPRSIAGRVDSQYFVGAGSSRGHSISSHSSGSGVDRCSSRCAGRTRSRAKRARMAPRGALAPGHQLPGRSRQFGRETLEADGLMARGTPHPDRRAAPTAAPRLRRPGRLARTPHRRLPFNAHRVGHAGRGRGPRETRSYRRSRHPPPPVLAARLRPAARGSEPGRAATSAGTRGRPVPRRRGAGADPAPSSPAGTADRPPGDSTASFASDTLTATWQLSGLPRAPQYWRATPDRVPPLLGIGGVIHDPRGDRAVSGHRLEHPVARHARGRPPPSHGALATKWCIDWCRARTCRGSTRAAIGSMLFRSPGRHSPVR